MEKICWKILRESEKCSWIPCPCVVLVVCFERSTCSPNMLLSPPPQPYPCLEPLVRDGIFLSVSWSKCPPPPCPLPSRKASDNRRVSNPGPRSPPYVLCRQGTVRRGYGTPTELGCRTPGRASGTMFELFRVQVYVLVVDLCDWSGGGVYRTPSVEWPGWLNNPRGFGVASQLPSFLCPHPGFNIEIFMKSKLQIFMKFSKRNFVFQQWIFEWLYMTPLIWPPI